MLNPTNKHGTKMEYTRLRDFLHSDGYLRIGTELFMRITSSRKTVEKHMRRLAEYAPNTGTVRVIRLTEKQYAGIWYLVGESDIQEEVVGKNSHIVV
ncbi:MAG: CRISPR-associated endonuclease Cas2 [Bacillota bacterium]|nr:CRISPR-associated endonuclease Cas2 [Bacillota bacterium]